MRLSEAQQPQCRRDKEGRGSNAPRIGLELKSRRKGGGLARENGSTRDKEKASQKGDNHRAQERQAWHFDFNHCTTTPV